MRRKLAGSTYSNGLEFGLRDGWLTAPSGFFSTQNIDLTIQYLVARSRDVTDFDQLPIPFRAVATDMQRGEMVVLSSGDLALAMRASMAVPGVFAPVTIDGRILGDGGLTRNVPVDIARETCADVVIAAAVPNPTPELDDLSSPLTLVARTLDVLIGANERQQLETLGPQDVKIVIDMGDIGSASFDRVADAIPLGRTATLAHRAELERYALPEAEYRAWRLARSRPPREQMSLAGVTVQGAQRVNEEFVQHTLGLQAGDVVDSAEIAARINRVFALSDFEAVGYNLSGDPERPTLDVDLHEKSWGPNILRFDLGFHIGTDENTAFTHRRRLPARLDQRARRRDPGLGTHRAHHGAGPGPAPAARSRAALVRGARPDTAALARGRLCGRRVRRPLPLLAWLGLPRRRPGVRQSHGAARRAALRRPVGAARDRHAGPARDFR